MQFPNNLNNCHKILLVIFKALNTMITQLEKLLLNEKDIKKLFKFMNLLSEIALGYHNLFQLVCKLILADERIFQSLELYKDLCSMVLNEHNSDHYKHPLLHFTSFTVNFFLEPRVFSYINKCFFLICSYFDKGQNTPPEILKQLLDCKYSLRQFYGFYLSLFPDKRFTYLKEFFQFFDKLPEDFIVGIGISYLNESLRSSSFIIKSLKIQEYIEFYSELKDESVQLECKFNSKMITKALLLYFWNVLFIFQINILLKSQSAVVH